MLKRGDKIRFDTHENLIFAQRELAKEGIQTEFDYSQKNNVLVILDINTR